MKLSVLLFPVLLALSSASLQDIVKKSSQLQKGSVLNPDLGNRIPKITPNGSMLAHQTPSEFEKSQDQSSSFTFTNTNLEWQSWGGSLPSGAVYIYNGYVKRYDYVCKYSCSSGFYTPSLGPYCRYPISGEEQRSPYFEILVNKGGLEILEWKSGSWGSVPENSVNTCSGVNVYVGKNKYGLGKVVPQHEAFFLPWEGSEYWYKYYEVLTMNKDVSSHHISDVRYTTDGVEIINYPPETMRKSAVTNRECSPVVKTVELSKANEVEKRWDNSFAISVRSSISAQIPFIGSAGIEFSTETTKQFSRGTTVVESITHSVSVEQTVPPNHSCSVSMVAYKYKADIPFTATLRRTYANGQTTSSPITGTYKGVDVGEVRAVVDRCEPLADARPCP